MPVMSITKILVSAAIVVGSLVGGAAQASADPNAFGADPNPFSGFSSSRQATAPADSPALSEEMCAVGIAVWGTCGAVDDVRIQNPGVVNPDGHHR